MLLRVHELRENRCSESHASLKGANKNFPLFSKFDKTLCVV